MDIWEKPVSEKNPLDDLNIPDNLEDYINKSPEFKKKLEERTKPYRTKLKRIPSEIFR